MSNTPNLQLPFLDANQNQKTVTHNAALTILDALVNCQVQTTTLTAPPAAPSDGQCWIVASGGTGAWAGKDLAIAAWQDGAWAFYAPNKGFVAYVDAISGALMWSGTAWTSLLGAITQLALGALGIGTAADPGNPLSAKLNAALFAALPTTASGTGDVRLTLSKQAAGNTASIVLQDNFSGRAEIGLSGDDNLHVKVSADGTTFYDAMDIAGGSGAVSFLASPTAPTPATADSSTKVATTAFVKAQGYVTGAAAASGAPVQSVAGRTGAITLGVTDVTGAAPLASPALSGTPTAPNAAAGTNTAQLATTSFVAASFVSFAYAGATYATASNATLTGTPTAPTQVPGDSSTRLATTAFVSGAVAAVTARSQVNDAAYTVLATDRTVAIVALTAARTLTLPAASTYPQGATLTVMDESGACSASTTITVASAGSDVINGAATLVLARPYGFVAMESNGFNKWTMVEQAGTLAVTNSGSTNNSATGSAAYVVHTPTVTLPAGFLQNGKAIRVMAAFRMTSGSAPPSYDIQLRAGTTVVAHIGVNMPTASSTNWTFGQTFVLQAIAAPSASSACECCTFGNSNASAGVGSTTNNVAMPIALATNAALTLQIATQWSAAGTGVSTIALTQFIVEVLN